MNFFAISLDLSCMKAMSWLYSGEDVTFDNEDYGKESYGFIFSSAKSILPMSAWLCQSLPKPVGVIGIGTGSKRGFAGSYRDSSSPLTDTPE